MTTEAEFFFAVCKRMSWEPSPWRLAVFAEWHRHEGMPLEQTWNPLATTRLSPATPLNTKFDIGYGAGNWNGVPVRVYLNEIAGETATAETLMLSYYVNVRRCFTDETGYPEAVPELATYVGSVAYGQALVDFMNRLAGDDSVGMTDKDILAVFGSTEPDAATRLTNAKARYEAAAAGTATDGSQYSPRDLAVNALAAGPGEPGKPHSHPLNLLGQTGGAIPIQP